MFDEELILKRTFSLYSRYGIKSVGVDDVAFMLGMSKKTIYEHFKTRENLIEKALSNNIGSFMKELDVVIRSEDNVFKKLCSFYVHIIKNSRKINPTFVYDLKKYSNEQYKLIIEFRNNKLYDIVSNIISQGVEEGVFINDANDRYIYLNQIDKISALIHEIHPEMPAPDLSEEIIYGLILNDIRGITTLKGHVMFNDNFGDLLKMI